MNKRVQQLRAALTEKETGGMFISRDYNRRYLSGFDGSAGYLIITAKKAILATDSRYWVQAGIEAPEFELLKISGNFIDWFPKLIKEPKIDNLGFESTDVSYIFHRNIRSVLRKKQVTVKLVPYSNIVENIRLIKEPAEIALMKKAADITDAAFNTVEKRIKAGMTEKQIAWEMEKALHELGSEGLAFPIIVGSGPNAALPHAKPSGRIVNTGEPIVIDMGGKYRGYNADLTRTVCAGKPDAKFKEIYNIVLEAQTTAAKQIRAGMTGHEADKIARDIIKKAGYGDAFGHSLGHGIGIEEHEQTRLGINSKDILKNGMVFTVEPGIYLEGWGGVRIEDTVIMEKGKTVPLNKAGKMDFK